MSWKKYNNYKMVYTEELGRRLMELGFKPVNIDTNKKNKDELVYIFENCYALRNAIRIINQ